MQYNITYRKKDKGIQFIISYKDSMGKWRQKSKQGFKKQSLAKLAADKMLDKLKENIQLKTNVDFEGITFGEFSKGYLEHSKLCRAFKTIQSTQTVLTNFSELNNIEMISITTLNIQKIVDELVEKELNPNTIRYYLKKLRIIFNAANNQYNIIKVNPVKNIRVPKPKDIIKKALTDEEISNLLFCFKNTKYYLFIYIAINTGMRVGEILGLTWSDIDFKDHTVNVNKQWKKNLDGTYGFGELKTKNSYRIIPISKKASDEIFKYKNVIEMDNRVVSFKTKSYLIACLSSLFKKKGFDITIHELRHTYATKLIANGMDFKTAAKLLGHDVQQTMKTYSHVNSDMLTRAQNLIENIF